MPLARNTQDRPSKRLSLLYQLFVVNQAARRMVRLALADTGLSGEAYALMSYIYGNGPRTLTQAARDFGLPITTVATMLAPLVEAGDIERSVHTADRRARLLSLTDAGHARMAIAIPAFTAAHRSLLATLDEVGVETEELFGSLEALRAGIAHTTALMEAEGVESLGSV